MKTTLYRNDSFKGYVYWSACLLLYFLCATISFLSCNGHEAEQRPGSSWDGSAKWAAQLADPAIREIAADAKLYTILGLRIYKDGRLPKNLGDWSITAWSESQEKEISVSIDHEGNLATRIKNSTSPPVNRDPLPDDWITNNSWCNSTDAFEAIPSFPSDLNEASEVSFNHLYCPEEEDFRLQAQWQVLLDDLLYSHFILYDGDYIGYCHL